MNGQTNTRKQLSMFLKCFLSHYLTLQHYIPSWKYDTGFSCPGFCTTGTTFLTINATKAKIAVKMNRQTNTRKHLSVAILLNIVFNSRPALVVFAPNLSISSSIFCNCSFCCLSISATFVEC